MKAIKILIPNVPSPRNLGDVAILESSVGTLKDSFKYIDFKFHSTEPERYGNKKYNVRHTLYSWALFKNKDILVRIINITNVFLMYLILRFNLPCSWLIKEELKRITDDYKKADLIVILGGGYIRSKRGIKQTLNFPMMLIGFIYAALTNKNIVVSPTSFGPFAYNWQGKIAAYVLKKMNVVMAREEYSYKKMKSFGMKNIILMSDLALHTRRVKKSNRRKKLVVGFTVRKWLNKNKQEKFEKSFINAIKKFSLKTDAFIQPIIQVDAPMYGEDDAKVTNKISKELEKNNVKVLKIINYHGLAATLRAYSNIDILVGMRMHSNILAATQGTPFVAISYEYKTEGITNRLGLKGLVIRCEDVTEANLYRLVLKTFTNRESLKKEIVASIARIQTEEKNKLTSFYKKYAGSAFDMHQTYMPVKSKLANK